MNKNVIISLTGLQYAEEEPDAPIEVITFGQHFSKDGEHFLFYDEMQENGMSVKCRIRFSGDRLEMNKRDAAGTKLVFMPGDEYLTSYATPYGNIFVGIFTHSVELVEEEDFLKAKIVYGLEINSRKASDCTLFVKVQSCEQPETLS